MHPRKKNHSSFKLGVPWQAWTKNEKQHGSEAGIHQNIHCEDQQSSHDSTFAKGNPCLIFFFTLSKRQRLPHVRDPILGQHRSPFHLCSSARLEGFCPVMGKDRNCCAFSQAISSPCIHHICECDYSLIFKIEPLPAFIRAGEGRHSQAGCTTGWDSSMEVYFWVYQGSWHLFFQHSFYAELPISLTLMTCLNSNARARCLENETSPFGLIQYNQSHFLRDN